MSSMHTARERNSYVQILEYLRIPEALRVVDEVVIGCYCVTNVPDTSEANGSSQKLLEAGDSRRSAVEVFGVTGQAPCVEVRLEDLRAHVVVFGSMLNKESVLVEESEVRIGG